MTFCIHYRTVYGFKHFLGRKFNDPKVQEAISNVPFKVCGCTWKLLRKVMHTWLFILLTFKVQEGPDGKILIEISYMGSARLFTVEEVTAMLFTKLKETGEEALKTKVKDVVISCPSYFTDKERRALLDAATIAGIQTFFSSYTTLKLPLLSEILNFHIFRS